MGSILWEKLAMATSYLFIWFIQLSLLFSVWQSLGYIVDTYVTHSILEKGGGVARHVILIPMVSCTFVHMP